MPVSFLTEEPQRRDDRFSGHPSPDLVKLCKPPNTIAMNWDPEWGYPSQGPDTNSDGGWVLASSSICP